MPYRIGEELFLDNVAQETEAPYSAVTRTKQGLVKITGVDAVASKGSKNLLTSGAAYDIIEKVVTIFQTPSGAPSPVLPLASTTVFGIVKIGSGITVTGGVISASGGGGGSPAGANTQVQFNNSGAFGASANFTYASATNTLQAGTYSRKSFHIGHLEGGHNVIGDSSTATNPIFTIGPAYNPAATTLGSMFGVGYSAANVATFLNSFGGGWGFYVAVNGVATIFLDGSFGTLAGNNFRSKDLAGSGTRMVTVDNNGFFLAQAIPTVAGSTGYVQYNNGGAFGASANLFWDIANSRLGINTTAPIATVDIVGALRVTTNQIFTNLGGSGFKMVIVSNTGLLLTQAIPVTGTGVPGGAVGEIQFNDGAGAFGASNKLYWDNTNNKLGIGTSVPNYTLELKASSAVYINNIGAYAFATIVMETTGGAWETGIDETGNGTAGSEFYIRSINDAAHRFTIQRGTGNVGIGTNAPTETLHVFGGALIASLAAGSTRMVVASATGVLGTQVIPGGGGGTPAGATNQIQYNNAGAFGANSLFVWDIVNGRLGIGTATPARKLQITNGDFQISTGNMFVDNLASVAASLQWTSSAHSVVVGINASGNGTANGQWFVYDAGAGTFQLTVQRGSGNVGIGTTAPGYSLDIATASQTAVRIRSSGTAQMNLIFTRTGGTATNWELYTPSGSTDLRFFSGVDVFTFATSGNLTVAGVYKRTTFRTGFLAGGHADLGDSSSMTNPIYAIGSAYGPDTDTTLGGMYGIGYCYGGTASFLSTIGGGWGMYVAAAGLAKIFFDAQFGTIIGNNFRSKDLAGGGTQIVTVDNNGFMLAGGAAPTSGTYTPTITPVTNVSTSSAQVFQYLRVGNTVTISGQINITVTTAASTWIARISLPVASNFTIAGHAAGSIAGGNISQSGFVSADPATDTIILEKPTTPAGNLVYAIHVTYRIL